MNTVSPLRIDERVTGADTEPQRTIAGNFEVAISLTDRRTLKMSGYVYSDDSSGEINKRIDVYQKAVDRQAIRVDVMSKTAQIAGHKANLVAMKNSLQELADKKGSGKKLTSTEQQALGNYEPSVRRANEAIDSLQAAIDAANQELATT